MLDISFIISCVWLQSINRGFTTHSCIIYNITYPFHNPTFSRSIPRTSTTLAYTMTDYKCQGKTFEYVVVDLKTPSGPGSYSPTSAYVQLSRATALDRVSIVRPFDAKDLCEPLP